MADLEQQARDARLEAIRDHLAVTGGGQPASPAPAAPAPAAPAADVGNTSATDSEEGEDEEPEVDAPAGQTPEPVNPRLQRAASLGFQNVSNEDELFDRMFESLQMSLEQRQRYEETTRQMEQFLANQKLQPATPQAAPASTASPTQPDPVAELNALLGRPSLNLEQARAVLDGEDESGRLKFRPGTPLELQAQVQQFVAWQQQFGTKFTQDPVGTLMPLLQRVVQSEASRLVQQQAEAQRAESVRDQMLGANAEWLFARDPVTHQLDFNRATDAGEKVFQWMNRMAPRYTNQFNQIDEASLWQDAMDTFGHLRQQQQARPAQPPIIPGRQPSPAARLSADEVARQEEERRRKYTAQNYKADRGYLSPASDEVLRQPHESSRDVTARALAPFFNGASN